MQPAFVTACFSLLAIGVLLRSAEAADMTVEELRSQLETFAREYIRFRNMPNEPKKEKDNAFKELWKIVSTNKWDTDEATSFFLTSLDPVTFNTTGTELFSQLNIIFSFKRTQKKLNGIVPFTYFDVPAIAKNKVTAEYKNRLDDIESFVKKTFARLSGKDENQVAYHYELFNGQDLENTSGRSARKEYVLAVFAIAKKV